MPFVEVPAVRHVNGTTGDLAVVPDAKPVKLYYRTYGKGDTKVVLIMGFAAGHDAWEPQVAGLAGTLTPRDPDCIFSDAKEIVKENGANDGAGEKKGVEEEEDGEESGEGITCLVFDNRGIGKSSAPEEKTLYTTHIMAKDALALMDHLGWEKAHIVGHSMGGMIAGKLAAVAPERVCSLAMVSVSGGGFHAMPRLTLETIILAYRFAKARTPHARAKVDLSAHFSKRHLEEVVNGRKRKEELHEQYVRNLSRDGSMQEKHGVDGHLHACWTHGLTKKDEAVLMGGKFLVSVIHGSHDVIAQLRAAERVALRLHRVARMVTIPGGHMITVEEPHKINESIKELIEASRKQVDPAEWVQGGSLWEKICREGELLEGAVVGGFKMLALVASHAQELPQLFVERIFYLFVFCVVGLMGVLQALATSFSFLLTKLRQAAKQSKLLAATQRQAEKKAGFFRPWVVAPVLVCCCALLVSHSFIVSTRTLGSQRD